MGGVSLHAVYLKISTPHKETLQNQAHVVVSVLFHQLAVAAGVIRHSTPRLTNFWHHLERGKVHGINPPVLVAG